MDFIAHK